MSDSNAGWISVGEALPALGQRVEVLHFGFTDAEIHGFAAVDRWGICPEGKDGGHAKQSTVSHWRPIVV